MIQAYTIFLIVQVAVKKTRLEDITPLVSPATAVRVLPISCAAIGKSPVLVFPENSLVEKVFSCLGQVHILPDETVFSPGTALVGAFYAWLFPFMDAMVSWTKNQGSDPETARQLVIETIEGACGMARHQKDASLADIWETLATPGGISELGARVLEDEDAFAAWSKALDAVTKKMRNPDEDCRDTPCGRPRHSQPLHSLLLQQQAPASLLFRPVDNGESHFLCNLFCALKIFLAHVEHRFDNKEFPLFFKQGFYLF